MKQCRKHKGDAPSTWGKLGQELGGGMKESGEAAGSIVGWGEGRLQEIVWGQRTAFGKLGKEEEEEQEECFPKCKPFSYSLTPD